MTWIEYLESKGVDPNAQMAFGDNQKEENNGEDSGDNKENMGDSEQSTSTSKGGSTSDSSNSSGGTNDAQLIGAMNKLTEALTQQALENRLQALTSNSGHTDTPEDRMHAFLFGKENNG